MSPTTLESTIIAEIESKQIPSTPREVRDKMIYAVNAANGLRYEIARFGDIEQQLKALQQKTEPLVLRAKELSDLVCQHMSSPRAIHETEELLQKVQQLERENAEQSVLLGKGGERECALLGKVERLERENAALLKDVYLCPPTSENDYEGLKWSDAFDELERENAELREDKESLAKAAQEVLDDYVLHLKVDTGHPCPENMVLCCTLRTAIDAARKEGQL